MEIIETAKGKPSLILDGYRYRLCRKTEDVSHWRCVKERSIKCKGMVKTKLGAVSESTPHQCVQNITETVVSKAKYECRKRARDDLETPVSKIFKDVHGNISNQGYDLVTEFSKYSNVKSSLCRIRRRGETRKSEQSIGQPINTEEDEHEHAESEEIELKKHPENTFHQTQEQDNLPPSTRNVDRTREKASSSGQPIHPYKRPLTYIAERLDIIESAVNDLKEINTNKHARETTGITTPCEYELFGQLVTTQLKKLPELNAVTAMQQIQACLVEQRVTITNQTANEQFQPANYLAQQLHIGYNKQ